MENRYEKDSQIYAEKITTDIWEIPAAYQEIFCYTILHAEAHDHEEHGDI